MIIHVKDILLGKKMEISKSGMKQNVGNKLHYLEMEIKNKFKRKGKNLLASATKAAKITREASLSMLNAQVFVEMFPGCVPLAFVVRRM